MATEDSVAAAEPASEAPTSCDTTPVEADVAQVAAETKPSSSQDGAKNKASLSSTGPSKRAKIDECEASAAKKLKGGEEALARCINKMLRDNFKGWEPSQWDLVIRSGFTLRQRLEHDKRQVLAG